MEQLQDAKQKFWQAIKEEPINGHRFTRHVLVEPFIVDFACVENKVIVELDEVAHSVNEHRTEYLRRQGFQVLRFFS